MIFFPNIVGKDVRKMLGKKDEWEEVRYGTDTKPRTESGRSRWSAGNSIRYGVDHSSTTQFGRSGFRCNLEFMGVIFDAQGKTSKMTVQLMLNMERCSKYAESNLRNRPAFDSPILFNGQPKCLFFTLPQLCLTVSYLKSRPPV